MIKFNVAVGLLLLGLVLTQSSAAESPASSIEYRSYKEAVDALDKGRESLIYRDAELMWSNALGTLAKSKSVRADIYLAKLATFRTDGAYSEEYSCAVAKRGTQYIKKLREQVRAFESANDCAKYAKEKKIEKDKFCAPRSQIESHLALAVAMKAPGTQLSNEPCGFEQKEATGSGGTK
jgi:hypothetical protein